MKNVGNDIRCSVPTSEELFASPEGGFWMYLKGGGGGSSTGDGGCESCCSL